MDEILKRNMMKIYSVCSSETCNLQCTHLVYDCTEFEAVIHGSVNLKGAVRTVRIRPGLHDIGLLFMPDRFPESRTKPATEYECLHEA